MATLFFSKSEETHLRPNPSTSTSTSTSTFTKSFSIGSCSTAKLRAENVCSPAPPKNNVSSISLPVDDSAKTGPYTTDRLPPADRSLWHTGSPFPMSDPTLLKRGSLARGTLLIDTIMPVSRLTLWGCCFDLSGSEAAPLIFRKEHC